MTVAVVYAGASVSTSVLFTAPPTPGAAVVPTTPTTVSLRFRFGRDAAWTTWVFGGAGAITNQGVGAFAATLVAAPGEFEGYWIGTGAAAVTVRVPPFDVSRLPA